MVVLMEYSPGLAMKRKGGEEPGLFSCSGDGDLAGDVPISCRATKIRRLESPGGYVVPVAVASVGTAGDVMMEEAQAPSLAPAAADEERAMVVFDPADAGRGERLGLWRSLFRSWAPLRVAGAEWHEWIRDMLREADSRTVREVLSSAQGEGADLAVVPWGADLAVVPWGAAALAPASTDQQASTAAEGKAEEEEEDAQGTAAMEVEEEMGLKTSTPGTAAGCREGCLYRWPQHCMVTPPLPAVPQASSVMCSW